MAPKGNKGTPALRNAGGYSEGGRPQKGGDGPAMYEGSGPKDKESQTGSKPGETRGKGMTQDSFKSSENQKNSSMAGVQDTSSGPAISDLKRSTPGVGVYQSGNNERGGKATGNYDSSVDNELKISWSQLDDLRKHQDSVKKGKSDKQDSY